MGTRSSPNLAPPFTTEVARENGRKGGLAHKGVKWSWQDKAVARARRYLGNGERTGDALLRVLVEKGLEGDVRAIELFAKIAGWRPNAATIKARVANVALTIDASTVPTPTQAVDVQAVTSHALPIPGNALECTLSDAGKAQATQVPMAQGDSAAGEAGAQRDNADAVAG